MAADSPFDRELVGVRAYRGLPDGTLDSKGFGACTRQCAIWEQDSRVSAILRPLPYPKGWPKSHRQGERPREKGIDVALAIDFATMAEAGKFDVGILMSTDTDLKPALKAVVHSQKQGGARAEVAAWSGTNMHNRRLSIPGGQLWCHWVDEMVYRKVADATDYS